MHPLKKIANTFFIKAKERQRPHVPDKEAPTQIENNDLKLQLQQLTKTTEKIHSELLELKKPSNFIEKTSPKTIDAGDLYSIFSEINNKYEAWKECDLIITCPTTNEGARTIFPRTKIIQLNEAKDLICDIKSEHVLKIGIISPWLLEDIIKPPYLANTLIKHCKRRLLFLMCDSPFWRKQLHQVGFYEVAAYISDKTYDFSSVGCLPDGSFDFHGSTPAPPAFQGDFSTYVASRTPINGNHIDLWRSVGLSQFAREKNGCIKSAPDKFSMSIIKTGKYSSISQEIRGTFSWAANATGHASLVACYAGPGDTNMYLALLEIINRKSIQLSLWVNVGQWERLAAVRVPEELIIEHHDCYETPLWFRVDQDKIQAGSGARCLIGEENGELKRVPCLGIRVLDNHISIKDITFSAN